MQGDEPVNCYVCLIYLGCIHIMYEVQGPDHKIDHARREACNLLCMFNLFMLYMRSKDRIIKSIIQGEGPVN